jgi:predicted porin
MKTVILVTALALAAPAASASAAPADNTVGKQAGLTGSVVYTKAGEVFQTNLDAPSPVS